MARLAVAPDEDVVARLEEDDLRPDAAALERAAHRRDSAISASPARTSSTIATRANRSRSETTSSARFGQELAGQVVDDGVGEVLEQLRRRGLAAARQAAEDHDVRAPLEPSISASLGHA